MTLSQDKDTVTLKLDRNSPDRNQQALNFGVMPVRAASPAAAPVPQFHKQKIPLAPIKVGKWVFDPKFKQRGYVPYLMGAAFALLLGVAGTVIYLVVFQTRPSSAAAQSGIKKLFTLTLVTSAGSGNPGSQDGFGSDASFNSPTGVTADSPGNIYVCDTNNNAVRKINTTGFVSTLAGNASQPPGFSDGKRGGALFNAPVGITLDSTSGLLFVVDSNNSLIRQIDPADGAVATIAGNLSLQPDFQDGQATSASFRNPFGIASDSFQNLYISDSGNNLVRKINSSRYVSTFAGGRSESRRFGAALLANLNKPLAITIDAAGNLYLVNQGSSQILKITTLNDVTSIAPFVNLTTGTTSSTSTTTAIAVDSSNNLWIVQPPPPSGVTQSPSFLVVSIATEAVQNISLSSSGALSFGYITFKPDGALVSSSNNGNVVLSFSISVVFDNGTISRSSSTLTASSTIISSTYNSSLQPTELSSIQPNHMSTSASLQSSRNQLDPSYASRLTPQVAITSFDSQSLPVPSIVPPQSGTTLNQALTTVLQSSSSSTLPTAEPVYFFNVTTLAGSGSAAFADGIGSAASFNIPFGVAVDSNGSIYVADTYNHRIRKISFLGAVTTLAGSGSSSFADGVGLEASFFYPNGVAVDSYGSIYVADTSNHRIRKISSLGNVTTLAGSGSAEFADGIGLAASFDIPYDVAVDSNGSIYVGDTYNHRIRKISSLGNVTTLAGSGSPAFADGAGLAASFYYPKGVAVDSNGSIYVADYANNRIRKVSSLGNVTTLAGNGSAAFSDGSGLAASFRGLYGVAVDSYGSIYVADTGNHRIRKISSIGYVTTLAGNGSGAFADGIGLSASFRFPFGVAVDFNGSIYVADSGNHRIRRVTVLT